MVKLDTKTDRQFWLTSSIDAKTVLVHAKPVKSGTLWTSDHCFALSRRYAGRLLSRTNLPLPKHGTDQVVRVVVSLEPGSVTKDFRDLRPRR